jgi:hypothetical protein
LIYKGDVKNDYVWFEFSWGKFKGLHHYKGEEEALADVAQKFASLYKVDKKTIMIKLMPKVTKRLSATEYISLAQTGKTISIN